jgi:hypothetical protein
VYFVIHIVSQKYVFYHPYSFLQNALHQVLFVHPSISADLLGLLDDHLFFMDMMYLPFFSMDVVEWVAANLLCLGDHPFWMNVIHFWWILTMLWDGCYKLAYCLGCIPPSILVGIYHVMEWMLQICFLSQ